MPLPVPAPARLLESTLLSDRPAWVYGLIVLPASLGGYVILYDGLDTSSGAPTIRLAGAASISNAVDFSHPIPFHRGLYVALAASVTEATVSWRPMTTEEAEALG